MLNLKMLRAALLGGFLATLTGCSDALDSESQFKEMLAAMEQAIENRDIDSFMDHVDPHYNDSQSRGWKDIRRIAQLHVLRNKKLHVYKHITKIDFVEDESADLDLLVAIAAKPIKSAESLSGMRAELMQFQVSFVYQDDTWRATSAEWARAHLGDFF